MTHPRKHSRCTDIQRVCPDNSHSNKKRHIRYSQKSTDFQHIWHHTWCEGQVRNQILQWTQFCVCSSTDADYQLNQIKESDSCVKYAHIHPLELRQETMPLMTTNDSTPEQLMPCLPRVSAIILPNLSTKSTGSQAAGVVEHVRRLLLKTKLTRLSIDTASLLPTCKASVPAGHQYANQSSGILANQKILFMWARV